MALGLGIGLSPSLAPYASDAVPVGPYVFTNAEAAAVVARMSVAPDNARKALIDTLVGVFKTAGIWTKFDVLYVCAAHDAQAARLDWKNLGGAEAFNATETLAPVFTADRGYAGDGAAGNLLASSYSVGSGVATTSNGHLAVFSTNNTADGAGAAIGARSSVNVIAPTSGRWCASSSAAATPPAGDSPHQIIATRRGANSSFGLRNGVAGVEGVNAVSSLGGTMTFARSTTINGMVSAGVQLSDAEALAYYNAARAYLIAVGVSGL